MRSTTTAAVIAALVVPLGSATAKPAKEGYMPGLVEIMLTTQSHHAKLWLAGSVGNWELAAYQADELKEGLEEAGKLVPDYKGIPVGKMVDDLIMPRIEEVESAIKTRDRAKLPAAYDKLTAACNSCHQGSNRGFIVVQRPPASAFPTSPSGQSENRSRTLLARLGGLWSIRSGNCRRFLLVILAVASAGCWDNDRRADTRPSS